MHKYVIVERKPDVMLRHSGPRPHKCFALYIDGKLFDQWREDSRDFNYASGQAFFKAVGGEVAKLREFFPGDLTFRFYPDWQSFPETLEN